MKIPTKAIDILLDADGKALATSCGGKVNVVPVSSVKIVDGKIWLINYFLGKTLHNIRKNPSVALAFWKGLEGYQVKGVVEHITDGNNFKQAEQWIAEILPDRVVNGLIILTTSEIFDVSADVNRAGMEVV